MTDTLQLYNSNSRLGQAFDQMIVRRGVSEVIITTLPSSILIFGKKEKKRAPWVHTDFRLRHRHTLNQSRETDQKKQTEAAVHFD